MLARSKLNCIETLISQTLIYSEISHETYIVMVIEKEKYRRLKEDIRQVKSQRRNAENNKFIKEGKWIRINKIIREKMHKMKNIYSFLHA